MPGHSKSRERTRSDWTLDNGKNSTRNANREAYNRACEAVEDYNYDHPGAKLQLETLNMVDNDPHCDHDVQIPITFTSCDNITRMGEVLSKTADTDCFIAYTSYVDKDDVISTHMLHIDNRFSTISRVDHYMNTFFAAPPAIRVVLVLALVYIVYKFIL